MKRNPMTYCELELISDGEWNAAHLKSAAKSWLQSIARSLADILLSNGAPKIWTTYDKFGTKRWHLYDLSIRQTLTFESEYEILIWLDGRYYRA